MIRNHHEPPPTLLLEPARATEVKLCPCGGALAGKLLTGWETGAYPGRTVLECTACGRREAIVRRMLTTPKPKKQRPRKVGQERVCARVACGKVFTPGDYSQRQRYCSVLCGNKDRHGASAPMYHNPGRSA